MPTRAEPRDGMPHDRSQTPTAAMSEEQLGLFHEDLAPWEEDDQAIRRVATVVFPEAPVGEFDYEVPDWIIIPGGG